MVHPPNTASVGEYARIFRARLRVSLYISYRRFIKTETAPSLRMEFSRIVEFARMEGLALDSSYRHALIVCQSKRPRRRPLSNQGNFRYSRKRLNSLRQHNRAVISFVQKIRILQYKIYLV